MLFLQIFILTQASFVECWLCSYHFAGVSRSKTTSLPQPEQWPFDQKSEGMGNTSLKKFKCSLWFPKTCIFFIPCLFFLKISFMCMSGFSCIDLCILCVYYMWRSLRDTMGTEPSFSARATGSPNHWATSPTPSSLFWISSLLHLGVVMKRIRTLKCDR